MKNITKQVRDLQWQLTQTHEKGIMDYAKRVEARTKATDIYKIIVKQLMSRADYIIANGKRHNHKQFKKHPNIVFNDAIDNTETFLGNAICLGEFQGYEAAYIHESTQSQKMILCYKSLAEVNEILGDTGDKINLLKL